MNERNPRKRRAVPNPAPENPPSKPTGPAVNCAFDELVPLEKLVPNPRNPNQHPQSQIALLAKVIGHQGWRSPVVAMAVIAAAGVPDHHSLLGRCRCGDGAGLDDHGRSGRGADRPGNKGASGDGHGTAGCHHPGCRSERPRDPQVRYFWMICGGSVFRSRTVRKSMVLNSRSIAGGPQMQAPIDR